ncbi:MAG: hypothetical protein ABI193_08540 [Minicystis sp.]
MSRSAHLAARHYRRASTKTIQTEGFLEDALAAALEDPEVWPRLQKLGGWTDLPEEAPSNVDTQETLPEGRADITLRWPNGASLVIELKAWDALPTLDTLERYAAPGHRVTVIAPHTTIYPAKVLPMLTWARLHALSWPGAPLVWEQLRHLIEATGVAVSKLDMPAIMGLVPTWSARAVLEDWTRPAVAAVGVKLTQAGWPCVIKEGAKGERPEEANGRFGLWAWPKPWTGEECFGVFCGVYVGKDNRAVLVPGVPDLRLMVHVNPKHATAIALRRDAIFAAAVQTWEGTHGGVTRQHDPESWSLLDVRAPLFSLVNAGDQKSAFQEWMLARVVELADLGIIGRLAAAR